MCGETTARVSQASATVFFKWPPTASSGCGTRNGNSISSGATPRPRRSGRAAPAMTRNTGSSAGRATGRSWCRKPAATCARRASTSRLSVSTGSPLTFAEVATSGAPKASSSKWCSGL